MRRRCFKLLALRGGPEGPGSRGRWGMRFVFRTVPHPAWISAPRFALTFDADPVYGSSKWTATQESNGNPPARSASSSHAAAAEAARERILEAAAVRVPGALVRRAVDDRIRCSGAARVSSRTVIDRFGGKEAARRRGGLTASGAGWSRKRCAPAPVTSGLWWVRSPMAGRPQDVGRGWPACARGGRFPRSQPLLAHGRKSHRGCGRGHVRRPRGCHPPRAVRQPRCLTWRTPPPRPGLQPRRDGRVDPEEEW